jgi:hypothetical protein
MARPRKAEEADAIPVKEPDFAFDFALRTRFRGDINFRIPSVLI